MRTAVVTASLTAKLTWLYRYERRPIFALALLRILMKVSKNLNKTTAVRRASISKKSLCVTSSVAALPHFIPVPEQGTFIEDLPCIL